jgi:hypothetical protein
MSWNTQAGYVGPRTYYEGLTRHTDDVFLKGRLFTARGDAGFIAGTVINVTFPIAAPISKVWPIASDWNLWQNSAGYYYSGVVGELEGQTFSLSLEPNDTEMPHFYRMDRVVAEHLMVISQPVLSDEDLEVYPIPGLGGASGGYHVFNFTDYDETTTVTGYMDHGSVAARGPDADTMTAEEALKPWLELLPTALERWRDGFIPMLRKLIAEAG